jgi:hypothetical protein
MPLESQAPSSVGPAKDTDCQLFPEPRVAATLPSGGPLTFLYKMSGPLVPSAPSFFVLEPRIQCLLPRFQTKLYEY